MGCKKFAQRYLKTSNIEKKSEMTFFKNAFGKQN